MQMPNPCSLLTNVEVAKTLGSKIELRDAPEFGGRGRTCRWTGANLSKPGYLPSRRTLMVMLWPSTRAEFDRWGRQMHSVMKVSGVGGHAFATTGVMKSVDVWQHGFILFITATDVTDSITRAENVARIAVGRL
jgi:hypothetical protein